MASNQRFTIAYSTWGLLLFLVALAAYVLPFKREQERGVSCVNNLKQITLAMRQYQKDCDGKFPIIYVGGSGVTYPENGVPYGWSDALLSYTRSMNFNNCPSNRMPPVTRATVPGYIDYWFNRNLSCLDSRKIKKPASVLTLGDGNDGNHKSDAAYSLKSLPPLWRSTPNSPARRHLGGANYAFADSHVKWLKPELISDSSGGAYTFVP